MTVACALPGCADTADANSGAVTCNVKLCWVVPAGDVAVRVSGYDPPARTVPDNIAVPLPGVKTRPFGSAPVRVSCGAGVPVASNMKLTVVRRGTLVTSALVMVGATHNGTVRLADPVTSDPDGGVPAAVAGSVIPFAVTSPAVVV